MIIFIIFVLIVIFVYLSIEDDYDENYKPTLEKDGFLLMNQSMDKVQVLRELPEGYVFLDYIYTINGCTLSTYHRDVTSSQYVYKTTHPVYTFIEYEYDGPTLSICPGSHKTVPLLFSTPVNVRTKSVLFNCDLVHAGCLNIDKKPRYAVQYKIAHVDDLKKLTHLQGIRKEKYDSCDDSVIVDIIYRKLSYLFSYIINHQFTSHLQNRKSSLLCKLVGEKRCFYNA